jgi:chemotaxis-related protein WspB
MLFVQFTLGGQRYLIEARQIERMLPLVPLNAIPHTPAWVAGVFDYDGVPVPVIDVSALALGRASNERLSTRMALVYYPHMTESGLQTRRLGLLLERATRTVAFEVSAFAQTGVDTPHARYLGPVASDASGLLQWVRIEDLLPAEVQAQLFTASAT